MSDPRTSSPTVRLISDFCVRIDEGPDGMTWARALGRTSDLNWELRYGSPERREKERLVIAEILSCYTALVLATPTKRRYVVGALKMAEDLADRQVPPLEERT